MEGEERRLVSWRWERTGWWVSQLWGEWTLGKKVSTEGKAGESTGGKGETTSWTEREGNRIVLCQHEQGKGEGES